LPTKCLSLNICIEENVVKTRVHWRVVAGGTVMGVLLATMTVPGEANAGQSFCAAAVAVNTTISSNGGVGLTIFFSVPYVAAASYNGSGFGIVATAAQLRAPDETEVELFNSANFSQAISGYAVLLYKC
jgi:hypothetical protein